jgi:hypothetical protein
LILRFHINVTFWQGSLAGNKELALSVLCTEQNSQFLSVCKRNWSYVTSPMCTCAHYQCVALYSYQFPTRIINTPDTFSRQQTNSLKFGEE